MPPIRKPRVVTPEQALVRLEDLCARAERCEWELREKMRKWAIAPADADSIIERLRSSRFVDDARFTRAYVNDAVRFARRGRLYMRRDLRMKRIREDIVAEALDAIDEDTYSANLSHILRAKLRSLDASLGDGGPSALLTREGRMKMFRFAVSRGYEPPLVIEAMRSLARD